MINPFKNINEEDKKELLKKLEGSTYHFNKGESILSTVLLQDVIGIVTSGCVQIRKTDYNGNMIIMEEVIENQIFGNTLTYYPDDHYEFVTLEETTLIIIDYFDIINFKRFELSYYDQFILNMMELFNQIIAARNERIRILTQKTTRDKLLEYFSIERKKTRSRIIYLPYSFSELANYLSVDRSAMMREIKYLKEDKIITVNSRKITFINK